MNLEKDESLVDPDKVMGSPQRSSMVIINKKFSETDDGPKGSIDGSRINFKENICS